MTYAEYLKTMGASDEDLKVLDTAPARKVFEKQQADLLASETARTQAEADRKRTEDWYRDTAIPEFTAIQQKSIAAEAEAARYKGAIKAAKDRGLLDITKDLGIEDTPVVTAHPAVPGIDASKFVTNERLMEMANLEGDAIAIAQDIAAEHMTLFPGKPLNMRELRRRAVAGRKSVEQQWIEENGVIAARAESIRKFDESRLAAAREEGRKEMREKFATEANPDLRAPVSSSSPFTIRKSAGDIRGKQPWEAPSEHTLSDDRVKRVATKVMTQ